MTMTMTPKAAIVGLFSLLWAQGVLAAPSRACLTPAARSALERVEAAFGPMQVVSTCRPGATVRGTGRPSRHASGNAVDFKAGARKAAVVRWLIANHHGGIMTYRGMSHIHIDVGPRFVALGHPNGQPNRRRRSLRASS